MGGRERRSLAGEVTLGFERGCADNSHTTKPTPRRFYRQGPPFLLRAAAPERGVEGVCVVRARGGNLHDLTPLFSRDGATGRPAHRNPSCAICTTHASGRLFHDVYDL